MENLKLFCQAGKDIILRSELIILCNFIVLYNAIKKAIVVLSSSYDLKKAFDSSLHMPVVFD